MPPASRITDMHLCPMFTPALVPIPHVGGPVLTGMPTVLTGGLPQARTTDMCMCVPAIPDAIVKGSLTVLVGGLMAARIGDTCSHGGALITGWPTVIIGDAGAVGGGAGAAPAAMAMSQECVELKQARDKADLADHAYSEPGRERGAVPAPYKLLDPKTAEGKSALKKLSIDASDLTGDGDTFKAEIFVSGSDTAPHYTVSFRGSRGPLESPSDWWENGKQAFGFESEDYSASKRLETKLAGVAPGRVEFVGHSKGGGQATAAALAVCAPLTTYNAAGAHPDSVADSVCCVQASAYQVEGEVVTTLQENRGVILGVMGVAAVAAVAVFGGPLVQAALVGYAIKSGLQAIPEAYGQKISLPSVPAVPGGSDDMIERHMMDAVIRGMEAKQIAAGCLVPTGTRAEPFANRFLA